MDSEIHKAARYDRQVRLWQRGGQARLEHSHVCVINGNTTSAEILKNLVLPGIGEFTIVDLKTVSDADLSGNFFLTETDVGSSIAEAICANLCELNADVRGNAVREDLLKLLNDSGFWRRFDVVVVTERIRKEQLEKLEGLLWPHNIPLMRVWTCGFSGAVRISRFETAVVDTHDPSPTFDLRLDCPWPELAAYADSFDLDELDDAEHAHVPYIVIYLKALEHWRKTNGSLLALPLSYPEKTDFRRNYVESMARNMGLETNFIEASQSIHRALQKTNVPASVADLFQRPETSDSSLRETKAPFWLLIRALKEFVSSSGGFLPLPGVLPDMVSTTSSYVLLQQIYRKKALEDKLTFLSIMLELHESLGFESDFDAETIANVCKNSALIHLSNGSQLNNHNNLLSRLSKSLEQSSDHNLLLVSYFGIVALDSLAEQEAHDFKHFVQTFCIITRIPLQNLTEPIKNVLNELYIHNTSRYLNVCSYMGGIVGQEILKIVTAQYIPLDNLYVFDGIKSVSEKWKAL